MKKYHQKKKSEGYFLIVYANGVYTITHDPLPRQQAKLNCELYKLLGKGTETAWDTWAAGCPYTEASFNKNAFMQYKQKCEMSLLITQRSN